MEAAGKQIEDVFRFAMLVANDGVFHPANVFKEEPIGLQGLDDFDPWQNQSVAFIFLGSIP